jgi:GAF domain-containing protein
MIKNPFGMQIIPDNDSERLLALKRYRIMDTPSEESFDILASVAVHIFDVSMALISLVDAERVFFKANIGMGDMKEVDRDKSLCALAILSREPTIFQETLNKQHIVRDTDLDQSEDNSLRFYAGAPIVTSDGFSIGTISIIDKEPREFTKKDESMLNSLATAVMDQIEHRLTTLNHNNIGRVILQHSLRNREN